jgi:hypothetical protein
MRLITVYLSWVKFLAACRDKSELNLKNMILRCLRRRDIVAVFIIDLILNF